MENKEKKNRNNNLFALSSSHKYFLFGLKNFRFKQLAKNYEIENEVNNSKKNWSLII